MTARHILEFADAPRHPAAQPDAVSAEQAAVHASDCAECQGVLQFRQAFDRRVRDLCCDVPVPHGLQARLLAQLQLPAAVSAASDAEPVTATAAEPPRSTHTTAPATVSSRTQSRARGRAWLAAMATAAACLVVAAGIQWYRTPAAAPLVALEKLESQVVQASLTPAGLPPLEQFENGLPVRMPRTLSLPSTARISTPRLVCLDNQTAAAYFFSIPTRRGRLEGRLIVLPKALVGSVPAAEAFLLGPVTYQGPFCATAWVEEDLVFVCALTGGEGELHRLVPRHEAS